MFYAKKIIICLVLFSSLISVAELPEPFNISPVLPESLWGWLGTKNQKYLEKFIVENKPQKVVEIGTWLGLSAIFIAKKLQSGAILFCIDPWVPYKDMENIPECQAPLKIAYQQFLSNCIHNQVTDKIKPMKMSSMQAVNYFSSDIDLIYIDGSHLEEDVYNDIIFWYPKLSSNGIMCGDDMGWPSVYRAVMRAKQKINVTVEFDDNFWWLERN